MFQFLKAAPHKSLVAPEQRESLYSRRRLEVFLGIYLGYAGYYLVRKNFSLVMPDLDQYSKVELGFALSGVSISYGLSKFLMGSLSDRSNAKVFLSLGLFLSGVTMFLMGALPWATASVWTMFFLLLVNGWFQGMGWPPCGRVMVHWFSLRERGIYMAFWNTAHNVGGGLMGLIVSWAVILFGTWQSKFMFPAVIAIIISIVIFFLVKDTPQSCGLPPIEEYKHDTVVRHHAAMEEELPVRTILMDYIFPNKLLWYIAAANAFVYLVRYGVLDWAPTYLSEVKGYQVADSSWAYFLFEYAGIPGTLLCGWLSDRVFLGRRAPATILYMVLVMLAVIVYWRTPAGYAWIDNLSLGVIGFLIYGPVMLIGVHALDLVPKKAAGTAAGFTGLFGYLGGALFANIVMGYVVDAFGWDGGFVVLLMACLLAISFTFVTWKHERVLTPR